MQIPHEVMHDAQRWACAPPNCLRAYGAACCTTFTGDPNAGSTPPP